MTKPTFCRRLLDAAILLLPLAAAAALGAALVAQYRFGIAPCELCHMQRWPYGALIALGLLAYVFKPFRRAFLVLMAIACLAELGLACFHFGVEQHWWGGTGACTPQAAASSSIEDLRNALLSTPVVRCDEINWRFLGQSMVLWNVLFSFGLSVYAGLALKVRKFA